MRKFYFFALLAVGLLVGCTDAVQNDVQTVIAVEVETPSYVIPMDDALGNLQNVLTELNPIREERGLQKLSVSNITKSFVANRAICTPMSSRRQVAGTNPSVLQDTLLYIVNFPDSSGYAILAADSRLPIDIFAITDRGSLSLEEFQQASEQQSIMELDDSLVIGGAEPSFINQLIVSSTIHQPANPWAPGGTHYEYGNWMDSQIKAPLVRVKWGQGTPFNDECPLCPRCGAITSAGCVAIAVAQILSVNRTVNTFDGVYMNWTTITDSISPRSQIDKTRVAHLIHHIGEECSMRYGITCNGHTSTAYSDSARIFLKTLTGYQQVSLISGYNNTAIRNMILAEKPVYISGRNNSANIGHAWVIDGLLRQSRSVFKIDNDDLSIISTSTEYRDFVHCNFGWNGRADGYYATGVFDLSSGPYRRDSIDPNLGASNLYDVNFLYMTY